jgi:DNA polymerase III alpha subunit
MASWGAQSQSLNVTARGDSDSLVRTVARLRVSRIPGEVTGQGRVTRGQEVWSRGFTPLHVASGYSARYGASLPHTLVQRAVERGMTTLALTDRDTVAGTVRFAKAAAAVGIRPLFGVDVAVATIAPPTRSADRARTPVRGGAHVVEPPLRITLLAQNAAGWARLCRLVSAAHAGADGALPVVSWPVLREYAEPGLGRAARSGVRAGTGPVRQPARRRRAAARAVAGAGRAAPAPAPAPGECVSGP